MNVMKLYTEGADQQSQNLEKKSQKLQRLYKNIAISLAFDKNINFTKYQLYQNLLYHIFSKLFDSQDL